MSTTQVILACSVRHSSASRLPLNPFAAFKCRSVFVFRSPMRLLLGVDRTTANQKEHYFPACQSTCRRATSAAAVFSDSANNRGLELQIRFQLLGRKDKPMTTLIAAL